MDIIKKQMETLEELVKSSFSKGDEKFADDCERDKRENFEQTRGV